MFYTLCIIIIVVTLVIVNQFYSVADLAMSALIMIYGGFLKVVSYINNLFDILAGIRSVEYNGELMSIYDIFFTNSAVSVIFWGITLIGAALSIIFSIIAITQRMADLELKRTLGSTLGQIGRTMLTFLITPILFITILQLASMVMAKTDEMFYIAHGGYTLDTSLFALTARNAALEDPSVVNKFATGELDYFNLTHVKENLRLTGVMVWIGIPMTLLLIVFYSICLLVLAVRLFMLIVLYIISPLFISSMALDNGAKYKGWRQMLFAKLFSGFSLIIAVKLLMYIVVPFLVGDVALSDNIAGDIVLKLLFAVGAVYAMYKSSGTLVSIVAPNAQDDGAMVMGSIVGAVKKGAMLTKEAAKIAMNTLVGAARAAGGDVGGGAKQIAGAAVDAAKVAGKEAVNAAGSMDGKG